MRNRAVHIIMSATKDDHGKLSWNIAQDVDYLNADDCVFDSDYDMWDSMDDHDYKTYLSMLKDLSDRLGININTLPSAVRETQ